MFDEDADLAPDEQVGVLEEVLCGWTVHLWVVQRGVLTQGLDLRPYLTARFPDGRHVGLGPDQHDLLQELIDGERYPTGYTVDRDRLAAAVPALQPPLLEPGGEVTLRVDGPHPDPDTFTYLQHGQAIEHGYQDLEGG